MKLSSGSAGLAFGSKDENTASFLNVLCVTNKLKLSHCSNLQIRSILHLTSPTYLKDKRALEELDSH